MTRDPIPEEGRGISRYLGVDLVETGDWRNGDIRVRAHVDHRPHLEGPAGGLRTGALLTLLDNVAGLCGGLGALPDGWVVSTNLMMRTARVGEHEALRIESEVLRRGRHNVVASVEVREDDARGALVADGVLTSSILVPESGPPQWARPVVLEADPASRAGAAPLPPLHEWMGLHADGPGAVAIEAAPHVRNPWGIVHGGMLAALVDAAAERECTEASGAVSTTVDVVLHFLAPARVGPVRAHAAHLGTRADGRVARVEVRDRGAGDRLCAVAITTARPLSGA